jgi:malate dehydrogenase (oxaloacetate-decarboxylating)
MLIAAATAIAECVSADQLNANFIVPSVFDARVVTAVANAVKSSA